MHPVCPALPSPAPSACFARAMFRLLALRTGVPDHAAADSRMKNDPPLGFAPLNQLSATKMALGSNFGLISELITTEFKHNILNTAGNIHIFYFTEQ